MGQTLLPVHSMIVIVMVFSDPLREGRPYLELSSMFIFLASMNCEFIRKYFLAFLDSHHTTGKSTQVLIKMFGQNIVLIAIGRLVLRKRASLKRMRKKGVRLMVTHFLPISFFSVLISVLYVTAESLGCIVRRREDDIECWDIVQSNLSFTLIFVTFFFVANLVLPFRSKKKKTRALKFMESNVTASGKVVIQFTDSALEEVEESFDVKNLMRFKLKFKEQFGLIVFTAAAIAGLFLFASSAEILEIHSLDSLSDAYETYKNRRKQISPQSVIDQKQFVRYLRESLQMFCSITCGLVILSSFFRNELKEQFGGLFTTVHLHTESEFEFAPAYTWLMYVMTLLVMSLFGNYVSLAVAGNDELNLEKFQRYTDYTVPFLFFITCMIFFSSPRKTTKANTYIYFVVPLALVSKFLAEMLHLQDFKRTIGNFCVGLVVCLFYKVIFRSRRYLSLQSDHVLKKHMLSIFRRGASAIGPMVFLYAEAIGCVMNYSNEDPRAGGISLKDCVAQRPGPMLAFCDWAKWQTFELIKKNSTNAEEWGTGETYDASRGVTNSSYKEKWMETWSVASTDISRDDIMWKECGWDATGTQNPRKFYNWTTGQATDLESGCSFNRWKVCAFSPNYDPANWNGTTETEADTANWNLVDVCPLTQCDGVGTPNNVIMMHLCFSLMYWVFFGFTFDDLTYDDVASLKPEAMQFHLLVQFFCMTAATVTSFFIFGLRSATDDSLIPIIQVMYMFVVFCWMLCFIAQGMHLRRQHMNTESVATDVLQNVFSQAGGLGRSEAGGLGMGMSMKMKSGKRMTSMKSAKFGASARPMKEFIGRQSETSDSSDGAGGANKTRKFSQDKRRSTTNWAKAETKKKGFKRLRPSTDLVVNLMGWLDERTKKAVLSSDLDAGWERGHGPAVAPMYRILMYVFFLNPFLFLVCAFAAPTPHQRWFRYFTYDITKYMALQMAIAFTFTSLKSGSFKWDFVVWNTFLIATVGEFLINRSWEHAMYDRATAAFGYIHPLWFTGMNYLMLYVTYKCKRSMQKFMEHSMKVGMVVDTGLIIGVASAFIPIIYISGESVACIWRVSNLDFGDDTDEEVKLAYTEQCSNLTYGVKAINVQSIMVFLYSTAIGPLLMKELGGIRVSCMARLDIGTMELYQLFNLVTTSGLSLWLFGTRSTGQIGSTNLNMFYALCGLWTIAFVVEVCYKRWDKIERGDVHVLTSSFMKRQPTKFTDKQLDFDMEEERAGGGSGSFHKIELLEVGEADIDDGDEEVDGVHNLDFSPGLV
ncbi:hypothetical protein TL16_g04100 [Triparma laevis f. inornata]|uniref:Uncharacterized protein n=1 Tax=Triparma laevis f. inornata TaxID=1714386 RepID=A0A9W7E3P8_9STRA|nr:hypothetical protein TL16_g04100 [Triparma laevis f. inornata]